MRLESVSDGLAIHEGPIRFVFKLPESHSPLEELVIRAGLALVVAAPESDGRIRAEEILAQGDEFSVRLGMRICTEFIGQKRA